MQVFPYWQTVMGWRGREQNESVSAGEGSRWVEGRMLLGTLPWQHQDQPAAISHTVHLVRQRALRLCEAIHHQLRHNPPQSSNLHQPYHDRVKLLLSAATPRLHHIFKPADTDALFMGFIGHFSITVASLLLPQGSVNKHGNMSHIRFTGDTRE